ncbi:MAG: diaminopimelate epimerase [Kiritimatiellae bacterium]|nr:diaminopimelate epimerase [Kiritimatiellia bacterium]
MNIPFVKMHGAANDFILVDDRAETFPASDRAWIAALCDRRRGVGAEGVILIRRSATAHLRMRFFNPDGGEVEMCGNGARCLARLAFELGIAPSEMRIETLAGELHAEVLEGGEQVRLHMTRPSGWALRQHIAVRDRWFEYHFVNTGVPHVVIEVEDLDRADVAALGRAIRYHERFQPAGTNVNFVAPTGPTSLRLRTYERGVEAETLACGTGIVAAALCLARTGRVTLPATVVPASGDSLTVDATWCADGSAENVTLTGPAVRVFEGVVRYAGGAQPPLSR